MEAANVEARKNIMRNLYPLALLFALFFSALPLSAQEIEQSLGVDARVNYSALTKIGPWDDRNYKLSQEDLALLAPNEDELTDPIPVFFRIELRRNWPELRRSGKAQYPRSALQIFRQLHGGYQVDGYIYSSARKVDGRFRVDLTKDPIAKAGEDPAKFLSGERRITSPNGAAESAIKINPVDTNKVIAGTNGPGSGQKMFYSTNGGDTWNAAAALPQGNTCCDPTVDWKSDGSLAHTATLGNCGNSGCSIWYYRSDDGGQTWNGLENVTPGDPRRELTTAGSDKEYLHVDKYASSPHLDNVYLTWHDNNTMQFARSTNDGNTWSKIGFSSDPQGIGSDITTDKNGHVYYFWPAFDTQQIVLKKSTNGGASFANGVTNVAATEASYDFPIPSMDTRRTFVYVSADADLSNGPYGGSIYTAWTDSTAATGNNASANHARIQVAYSRNGGTSWTVVTPHETADQNTVDRYHPWLAVGPDGKVHVAFYDTRRSGARTSVDLFYSSSVDGGQTFSTPIRLTAQQSPKINDSFEFGDYNGLDVVMNDVIAIFTDNRNEGGGGGDSVDVYAAGRSDGPGGNRPTVTITSPANGTTVAPGSNINFAGTATDTEDGNLTASLSWSSNLDGNIGTGGSFSSTLTLGTHTITASATDSDSLTGTNAVLVTVTDGNLPTGLIEDFEGDTSGWTANGLWHLVENSACASPGYSSATHAMYYGQDAGCDYDTGTAHSGNLISPEIGCLTASSTLNFQYFRQVEKTNNDPYETVSVAASVAGQNSWTTLWSKSSLETSENAWTASGNLSLAAFASQTIELRFRFDSVDNVENAFVGWLVDDVVVTGSCGSDIFADGFEEGDTSRWSSTQ